MPAEESSKETIPPEPADPLSDKGPDAVETPGLEQSGRSAKATIEIIRDFTSLQGDGEPIFLVNVAAGNEPMILGVRLAQETNRIRAEHGLPKARIIVPVTDGDYDRQRRILLEESPSDPWLIHLDTEYGKILEKITSSQGNFSEHLQILNAYYDETERAINQHFGQNFEARSLTSSVTSTNSPSNIIGTIDVGSRLIVNAPRRYFMFPVMLSELITAAQRDGLPFSESDMLAVAHRMRRIEQTYSQAFIPKVNTLSYQYLSGNPEVPMERMYDEELGRQPNVMDGRSRVFTPAMKPAEPAETHAEVNSQGIYVVFSGTGSAAEQTRQIIPAAKKAGLAVYTQPWVEDVEGVHKIPPSILSDPRILAVFGRAGWGTGWSAQNLAMPWFVTPYEEGDDPEIYFNNLVVERLRLGKVLDVSSLSTEDLAADITTISPGLQVLNGKIKEEFGTTDGIRFMAEVIAKDYLGKA